MRYYIIIISCIFSFFWLSSGVIAGPQPDAGQILQEQKQPSLKVPQKIPVLKKEKKQAAPAESEDKPVLRGFRFTGYEGVTNEAKLEELSKPAIGMRLTFAGLQAVTHRITEYLRDEGYILARAYLPKQEIIDGIVQINIISGRVEGLPIVNLTKPARIRLSVLDKLAQKARTPDGVMQQKKLERSLLLINGLPGISGRSVFKKGKLPGTTRVYIDVKEGPLFGGAFSLDNAGNRFTGVTQSNVQVTMNDISGYGDRFSVDLKGSEGLAKARLSYSIPLGSSGLQSSISYTGLRYELGKEFKSYDVEGTAETVSGDLNYPYVLRRSLSIWHGLHCEYRSLEDQLGGVTTKERLLNLVTTDISFNRYDRSIAGGGLSYLKVSLSAGELDLKLAADAAADSGNTEGGFTRLNYDLMRLQRLDNHFTLFGSISGQLADGNLDSSEKFILGGETGVRAYPVGEASGDEGFRLTTEIRYDLLHKVLSGNLQFLAFFDAGHVTLHNSPWTNSITSASGDNNYWLSGVGFGINLSMPGRYRIQTSYAHTLGNNPGRSTSGRNADNKNKHHRFWVKARIFF